MSALRIFLAIAVAGAAVTAAVAGSLQIGLLSRTERATRGAERSTPVRTLRAELPRARAGADGWTWPHGTPGFDRQAERFWNGFALSGSLRARLSAAARADHLTDLRVMRALRLPGSSETLALAAAGGAEATCLAAIGPGLPVRFRCLQETARDGSASALVVAAIERPSWRLHLLGVARGDVRQVRFVAPGLGTWLLYERERSYLWGTFALGVELPHSWSGRLIVVRNGARDSVELASDRPGTGSFLVRGRSTARTGTP